MREAIKQAIEVNGARELAVGFIIYMATGMGLLYLLATVGS